jgi:hypothetical protein
VAYYVVGSTVVVLSANRSIDVPLELGDIRSQAQPTRLTSRKAHARVNLAYDRPGPTPRNFLAFYLCSRVGLLPYNSARRPAFIEAQRLLGSLPSFWFSRVAATTDPHLLLSHTPMSFSYHRLDTPGMERSTIGATTLNRAVWLSDVSWCT